MKSQSGETIGPGTWLIRSTGFMGESSRLEVCEIDYDSEDSTMQGSHKYEIYYRGDWEPTDGDWFKKRIILIRKLDLEKLANEK